MLIPTNSQLIWVNQLLNENKQWNQQLITEQFSTDIAQNILQTEIGEGDDFGYLAKGEKGLLHRGFRIFTGAPVLPPSTRTDATPLPAEEALDFYLGPESATENKNLPLESNAQGVTGGPTTPWKNQSNTPNLSKMYHDGRNSSTLHN
ncbi:hypothetical protein AHAS_Ahas15G0308000 [Arachis hypogaea]